MKYLKDGGFMAVEIGIYQAEPVKQMAIDNGWQNIEIIKDYAGIDRVVLHGNRINKKINSIDDEALKKELGNV